MSKRSGDRREQRRQQAQREAARVKRNRSAVKDGTALNEALKAYSDALMSAYQKYLPRWESVAPSPEPEQPPLTFSECVIGYRSWLVDATGQLRAVTMTKQTWMPGVNVAKCCPNDTGVGMVVMYASSSTSYPEASPVDHAPPHRDCHCGLYAYNDFEIQQPDWTGDCDEHGRLYAVGAIAAWGDLRVHADGFRASHACPVALAYPSSIGEKARNVLERVADEYRVALVHVDTLQAEAEQHGTPLPAEARPKARELESPLTFGPSTVTWQSGTV